MQMVIYAEWVQDSADYEIPVVFMPGNHATGNQYITSLNYNLDVGGNYTPAVRKLPDPESCNFEVEEGYEFTYWIIEGDSSGAQYTDSVITADFAAAYPSGATFIAQWR